MSGCGKTRFVRDSLDRLFKIFGVDLCHSSAVCAYEMMVMRAKRGGEFVPLFPAMHNRFDDSYFFERIDGAIDAYFIHSRTCFHYLDTGQGLRRFLQDSEYC